MNELQRIVHDVTMKIGQQNVALGRRTGKSSNGYWVLGALNALNEVRAAVGLSALSLSFDQWIKNNNNGYKETEGVDGDSGSQPAPDTTIPDLPEQISEI
jgi:hypothetical protein